MPDQTCPHCGVTEYIASDVAAYTCKSCWQVVYRDTALLSPPRTKKATVDRTGDVLRVTCPHCGFVNEFSHFEMVFTFLCHECAEPVEGLELRQ